MLNFPLNHTTGVYHFIPHSTTLPLYTSACQPFNIKITLLLMLLAESHRPITVAYHKKEVQLTGGILPTFTKLHHSGVGCEAGVWLKGNL